MQNDDLIMTGCDRDRVKSEFRELLMGMGFCCDKASTYADFFAMYIHSMDKTDDGVVVTLWEDASKSFSLNKDMTEYDLEDELSFQAMVIQDSRLPETADEIRAMLDSNPKMKNLADHRDEIFAKFDEYYELGRKIGAFVCLSDYDTVEQKGEHTVYSCIGECSISDDDMLGNIDRFNELEAELTSVMQVADGNFNCRRDASEAKNDIEMMKMQITGELEGWDSWNEQMRELEQSE